MTNEDEYREARARIDAVIPREVQDMMWPNLGNCVNCGRPVTRWPDVLIHLGPDGFKSNRGCRAASFDWRHERPERELWDDSLRRSLTARLPRAKP